MRPAQRRELVATLVAAYRVPTRRACEVVHCNGIDPPSIEDLRARAGDAHLAIVGGQRRVPTRDRHRTSQARGHVLFAHRRRAGRHVARRVSGTCPRVPAVRQGAPGRDPGPAVPVRCVHRRARARFKNSDMGQCATLEPEEKPATAATGRHRRRSPPAPRRASPQSPGFDAQLLGAFAQAVRWR